MNDKKSVKIFKRKYKLKNVNSQSLTDVLNKQGFTVIEYNGIDNDGDIKELVEGLKLEEQIKSSRAFTYMDEDYRLVFVNEDLNEEEKTIVLAHEEGHIWNSHLKSRNVIGEDVIQEYQANEFCHFLLSDRTGKQKKIKSVVLALTVILLVGGTIGICNEREKEADVYKECFYRTRTGKKYHLKNCIYIKDKADVQKLTEEEFESGEYEPCSVCMPEG